MGGVFLKSFGLKAEFCDALTGLVIILAFVPGLRSLCSLHPGLSYVGLSGLWQAATMISFHEPNGPLESQLAGGTPALPGWRCPLTLRFMVGAQFKKELGATEQV